MQTGFSAETPPTTGIGGSYTGRQEFLSLISLEKKAYSELSLRSLANGNGKEEEAMSVITIECPDDVLRHLNETPEVFAREARIILAVKLYEMGRLSSGKAAELADMGRVELFDTLGKYGVSVMNLPHEELEADFHHARTVRG
jgi:predicted HTH domain antitoxin